MKVVPGGFILDIVKELRGCSKNEAVRLMKAGAVTVDGLKVLNPETRAVGSGMIIKVGKRDFAKVQ
jgi:tyrosyl-tRNA synthetase